MKVGHLRDSIVFETPSTTVNSRGESTPTWSTFATVFGEIRSVSGQEYIKNERIQGELTHQITIRFLSGLVDKMRASVGGKYYEIVAVLPDRTGARMQQVMCRELAV